MFNAGPFAGAATDALHRESGSIVSDAEVDPTTIGSNVGDLQSGIAKFMHPDRFGIALSAQFPAATRQAPSSWWTDIVGWTSHLERVDPRIDALELCIAVRWFVPLRALLFGRGLKPKRRSSRPTSF